jgi:peptidoglycan/LPS O-acetylase OafA/YrhL
MPEFLLGTLLYFAFRDYGKGLWLSSDFAVLSVLVTMLTCLHFGVPDLLIVSLFAALVLLAVSNSGAFAKVANTGPLIWLGEISYSLYLIHGLIQFIASKGLGALSVQHTAALSSGESLALMMAMLALCIFCATATYSGVEVIWRRKVRTLLGDREKESSRRSFGSLRA